MSGCCLGVCRCRGTRLPLALSREDGFELVHNIEGNSRHGHKLCDARSMCTELVESSFAKGRLDRSFNECSSAMSQANTRMRMSVEFERLVREEKNKR